jgi:hypothetical protein
MLAKFFRFPEKNLLKEKTGRKAISTANYSHESAKPAMLPA